MKVDVSTRFSSYLFALLSLLFCRLSCFPTPFPFSCTHSEKCFLIWQQLSADIKNDKLIKKWIYQAALQLINGSALSRLFAWSPLQLHCPSFLPLLEMYPSFPPFFSSLSPLSALRHSQSCDSLPTAHRSAITHHSVLCRSLWKWKCWV